MSSTKFQILYTDVGGVLGTNGWDTPLRSQIANHFQVDHNEAEERHRLMFDAYESGKMTFEDYLKAVYFAVPRPFTVEEVRDYAYEQSIPWLENINFMNMVKQANRLKLGVVSNEGGGLTEHRVEKFGLRGLADFLVFSCFVHMRKPDRDIWRLALNLAQVRPEHAIYVDDRKMFVDVAEAMGFKGVHHTSLEETRQQLLDLGLVVD